MKNILSDNAFGKIKEFCSSLSDMQLKADCNANLSLCCSEPCEHPQLNYSIKGSSKCTLANFAVLALSLSAIFSLVCLIFRCLRSD